MSKTQHLLDVHVQTHLYVKHFDSLGDRLKTHCTPLFQPASCCSSASGCATSYGRSRFSLPCLIHSPISIIMAVGITVSNGKDFVGYFL